ncbi:MAG: sterol desaturase family protein [Erythrobacter sp.]
MFTFDLGRYLIAAGTLTLVLWLARRWSEQRRIQPRRASRTDYVREITSSFRTVFFFALTGLSTLVMIETGIVEINEGTYTAGAFFAQLVAMILAHDAYFYWMHRALHHRRLFRATHLHHHRSRTPTPWAAYSFSAWEGVTESAFVPLFLLGASLLGVAYIDFAIFIFLAWMILRNVMGHAGVELHPAGWVDSKWTDWLTTTTHHDLHHSEGNHNFGLYFTWWDRWMGTEHPDYKVRFRRVAKPLGLPQLGFAGASDTLITACAMSITATGTIAMLASMGAFLA